MRRVLPVTLLAAILCVLSVVPALAQSFPSKTVRFVVPYSAGGTTDVLARAIAVGLGTLWSHSVVVANVTGAGSLIGAERVATAAPDGHTLLMTIGTRTEPVSDTIVIGEGLAQWGDPDAKAGPQGRKSYGQQVMIDTLIKVPERHSGFPPRAEPSE